MEDLRSGVVLDGRWRIGRKIGEGACAKVYEVSAVGKDASDIDFPLVAKVIPLPRAGSKSAKDKEQRRLCDTLYHEYNVCVNNFQDFQYLPRRPSRFYGECDGVRYLIMEKLERDLSDVAKQGGVSFAYIGHLGLQILDGLKFIHQKGFYFIDIKPDNFMLKGDRLYFVDFGLVEKRPNPTAGLFGSPEAVREFAGTATYSSINMLSGKQPTPADEIQAMIYVLLALLNGGRLPWTGAKSDTEIINSKRTTNMMAFASSFGAQELAIILDDSINNNISYDQFARLLQVLANKTKSKSTASTSSRAPDTITTSSSRKEVQVSRDIDTTPKRGRKTAAVAAVAAGTESKIEDTQIAKPNATRRNLSSTRGDKLQTFDTTTASVRTRRGGLVSAVSKASATAVDLTLDDDDEIVVAASAAAKRRQAKETTTPSTANNTKSFDVEENDSGRKSKRHRPVSATRKRSSSTERNATPSSPKIAASTKTRNSRVVATSMEASAPFSSVDPDDILGFEDGVPSYLNACLDNRTAAADGASVSGPFSLRKSEYHRHRLSSFGNDEGGNSSTAQESPAKRTRKSKK